MVCLLFVRLVALNNRVDGSVFVTRAELSVERVWVRHMRIMVGLDMEPRYPENLSNGSGDLVVPLSYHKKQFCYDFAISGENLDSLYSIEALAHSPDTSCTLLGMWSHLNIFRQYWWDPCYLCKAATITLGAA
jgi:hypothetical protein